MPSDYLQPTNRDPLVSADLEFLAEQLSRDAQWISSRYPACKPKEPLRRPRRIKWLSVACAAALLLLAIDGFYLWSRPARHDALDSRVAVEAPAVPSKAASTPAPRPISTPSRAAAAIPLLNQLNGPEKAGVMELIEQGAISDLKQSL